MFTVKTSDLANPSLAHALSTMANTKGLGTKTAYDVGRFISSCTKLAQQVNTGRNDLMLKHAKTDEAGNVEMLEGKIVYKDQAALEEAAREFFAKEISIDRHRLNPIYLEKIDLSPVEIMAIQPFMATLDAVPEGWDMKVTQTELPPVELS